ncbi:MAG: PKD domain-containing protein [Candidatus Hydrogenedentes bacterium]|nr:PKD domain-containing protein [Candidatus Hydrogenedentota bacterium]
MKKLNLFVIVGAALCTLPAGAFADAQNIDFSCIMEFIYNGMIIDMMPMPWVDLSSIDYTEQGGLGIPDVKEFKLLSLILSNPVVPSHNAIHTAFATNASLARTAIGSTIVGLTTSSYETGSMARQPIPGTDPQQYYGADGLMAAYLTFGEWDLYMETMEGFKDSPFGTYVTVPTSSEGYMLRDDLGMCGDVDGDGVSNSSEYWALSSYSWAGAIHPGVAEGGCVWNIWACTDQNNSSVQFAYNPDTERVYTKSRGPITWDEARSYTFRYPGGAFLPTSMVWIRNEAENDYVRDLGNGNTVWIGCTDEEKDGAGHTAPNPADWYWIADSTRSEMTYTNWSTGEPAGVEHAEDCGTMGDEGTWNDVAPTVDGNPRRYYAIFETTGTWPDLDQNGAPDAFEDNDGDFVPDGFEAAIPEADFEATVTSGDMPLKVEFTDLHSGPTTSWAWDFGDGATSTEPNPTHVYVALPPFSTYTVSLTVTNEYGSDTATKTAFITVYYVCALPDQLAIEGPAFNSAVMGPESVADEFKAALTALGVSTWADWNIEGIENYPPAVPGDGLNDAVQMALLAYVACHTDLEVSAGVYADVVTNKDLFEADVAELSEIDSELAILGLFTDLFAGMIGSSPEMKTTINELILTLTGGANGLPSLDDYIVFGGDAKTGPLFAGYGDLDGDGLSNEAEWNAVVAAGGGLDAFLIAATDPDNFWPGNPLLPVAGVVGVGLLAGVLIASAGYVLRKKA